MKRGKQQRGDRLRNCHVTSEEENELKHRSNKEPLCVLFKEKHQKILKSMGSTRWLHGFGGVLAASTLSSCIYRINQVFSHGIHQIHYLKDCLTSPGIVHADLRPGNIMEADSQQLPVKIKLTDFGTAFNADSHMPGPHLGTGAPQWGCLGVVPWMIGL